MTKQEFLSVLREALEGNIPRSDIEENIRFYDNYFKESEKSQEMVCDELGDPRLIARSIIDSFTASKGPMADYYTEQARSEFGQGEKEQTERQNSYGYRTFGRSDEKWYDKILRILMLAIVLVVVAAVCIFLLRVAVYVVIPVVLIVLIIKILLDLFHRY